MNKILQYLGFEGSSRGKEHQLGKSDFNPKFDRVKRKRGEKDQNAKQVFSYKIDKNIPSKRQKNSSQSISEAIIPAIENKLPRCGQESSINMLSSRMKSTRYADDFLSRPKINNRKVKFLRSSNIEESHDAGEIVSQSSEHLNLKGTPIKRQSVRMLENKFIKDNSSKQPVNSKESTVDKRNSGASLTQIGSNTMHTQSVERSLLHLDKSKQPNGIDLIITTRRTINKSILTDQNNGSASLRHETSSQPIVPTHVLLLNNPPNTKDNKILNTTTRLSLNNLSIEKASSSSSSSNQQEITNISKTPSFISPLKTGIPTSKKNSFISPDIYKSTLSNNNNDNDNNNNEASSSIESQVLSKDNILLRLNELKAAKSNIEKNIELLEILYAKSA